MKPTPTVVLSILYLTIIYLLPVIYPELIAPFGKEDGIVESIGAFSFLIASILFMITYLRISKQAPSGYKKPEALWMFGLAILFFIACGEEISWGQRIFNFATPEGLKEINQQKEFNIHNINLFNGRDETGEIKTGLRSLITSHRIFYAGLSGLFIIVPLIMLFKGWLSRLILTMKIPITPIWISGIFFATLVLVKITQFTFAKDNNDLYHALVEIMETNIAFVTALLGWSFYQSEFTKNGAITYHDN
jgi:hypothetical protein